MHKEDGKLSPGRLRPSLPRRLDRSAHGDRAYYRCQARIDGDDTAASNAREAGQRGGHPGRVVLQQGALHG